MGIVGAGSIGCYIEGVQTILKKAEAEKLGSTNYSADELLRLLEIT